MTPARTCFKAAAALLLFLFGLLSPTPARAYSLLTHEQLIDLAWKDSIVPLLLSRYPGLTPAQLEHARAFAYGGCVIQDIGYYPFGGHQFSDLLHYVRTGDFIVNLLRNATNADELAFAVGALSHYIGDTVGHATATNLAVPVEFPRLRARYGNSVSYAQGEHQHVQTEFAFDISEIAQHHLAPLHYLRHVGLEVPTRQLALAFYQTYGLREDFSAGRSRRINVRGYRFAVRNFVPRIAYAVTILHHDKLPAPVETPAFLRLQQQIATIAAENDWDHYRKKPGIGTYSLAGLLFILPKIGPIKLVAVKGPTATADSEYLNSVVLASDSLHRALSRFTPPRSAGASSQIASAPSHAAAPAGVSLPGNLEPSSQPAPAARDPLHPLPNRDLDTGNPVQPGGYRLADQTYAKLLHSVAEHPTEPIPPGIKADILGFYADPNAPIITRKKPAAWAAVQHDLATLATMPTSTAPPPFTTYDDSTDTGTNASQPSAE